MSKSIVFMDVTPCSLVWSHLSSDSVIIITATRKFIELVIPLNVAVPSVDLDLAAFLLYVRLACNCIRKVLSKYNFQDFRPPTNENHQLSLAGEECPRF
jgi:hypothetical protein